MAQSLCKRGKIPKTLRRAFSCKGKAALINGSKRLREKHLCYAGQEVIITIDSYSSVGKKKQAL
jgi:hypothetical protein